MANAGGLRITLGAVWLLFTVFNLFTCLGVRGDVCGKPGRPLSGNYNPIKIGYNVSEEIVYSCDLRNGYLIGNSRRSCLNNGSWSGPIPTCDTNLAFERTVSGTGQNCDKKSLVDNNGVTFCNIFNAQPVYIDLGNEYDIAYILLTLNPHMYYSLNAEVTDGKNVKRQCKAVQNQYIDESYLQLLCNNGNPLRGKQITVTVFSNVPIYEIGAYSNGKKSCGEPDVPANAIFSKTSANEAKFSCEQSYFLQGDPYTWCVNGQWNNTGQSCNHAPDGWQGCGEPGYPSNGDRYIEGKLQNESNYFCNKGFALVGNSMRKCDMSTTWSSSIPKCANNVALNKLASHQQGVVRKPASTDENQTTCESQTARFYGYIDLEKSTEFNSINLTLKASGVVNISVYATNNTNIKSPSFRDTSSLKGVCIINNVWPSTPLQCNHPEVARYIVMYFSQTVSVCEVVAFNSNEILPCGQPDQPLHGRILNRSAALTTYACEPGFKMNGSDSTRCMNGVWTNKPPLCLPIAVTTARPVTSTSTKRPITTQTRYTSTPYVSTHSHDDNDDGGSSSKAMAIMGIAVGASAACVAIILVSVLVYCFVRKHYKNRSRCDHDHSSRGSGSRSECYTTTYRIPDRRSGGDGDDVSIHLYDTIKEPEYLFPRRPNNLPDSISNDLYDNNSSINGSTNTQRQCLLPQRPPLYDSVSPELEAAQNESRLRMALPGSDDPLLDCGNRPRTSL